MTLISISAKLRHMKVKNFIMINFTAYELKFMKMAEYLYDLTILMKKPRNQFLLTSAQL